MMFTLFERWLGRKPKPAAPPVAPPPAPEPQRRTGLSAPPPAPSLSGLGARRPLVAAGGALAGFEFHAGLSAQRLRRGTDAVLARAVTGNLLGAMRLCTGAGQLALAELPMSWLQAVVDQPDGLAALAPGMHLLLQTDSTAYDDAAGRAQWAAHLRQAGVRLGWTSGVAVPPLPGRPDFLRVLPPEPASGAGQLPDAGLADWLARVAATNACWPGVPLVMLDLPDVDTLEAVLRPPVVLAACAVGLPAQADAQAQALPPQTQRLLALLNRLVRDDDHALLVADIKADAALSLRLLQLLNSAGASPGRVLDSIDQAVQVLGRDALYRWVAQLLVRQSPPRPAAAAMQALALARARLLELLAQQQGEPNPGGLYLLGLASMLPLLLRCRLDEAVAQLQLPVPALQALRAQGGPWQPWLDLVLALERNDLTAATPLAEPCGGLDAVLALSARAWLPD